MTSATKEAVCCDSDRKRRHFQGCSLRGDILVDLQEKHCRWNSECKGPGAGTTLVSWRSSEEHNVARAE